MKLIYIIIAITVGVIGLTSCETTKHHPKKRVHHNTKTKGKYDKTEKDITDSEPETTPTPSPSPSPAIRAVYGANENGILISSDLLNEYKTLEKKFGSIPQDANIRKEGNNYRIPQEVANHFSAMKRSGN